MADVAVSAQLQQWSFEKPSAHRPERSDSTASSPDLSHREPETLRIDAAAVRAATSMHLDSQDPPAFQARYLSSEEDLSPMDGNTTDDDYDSDVSIHEAKAQPSFSKARTMSISRWEMGKRCDLAVTVSYVSAGRPKVIQLAQSPVQESAPRRQPPIPQPTREAPVRSASLALLPMSATSKLRQQDQQMRRSMVVKSSKSRPESPALTIDTRRPSTGSVAYSLSNARRPSTGSVAYSLSNKSAVLLPGSRSGSSLHHTDSSTSRSSSPSVSENSTSSSHRPKSAIGLRSRASLYLGSNTRPPPNPLAPFPPLTPQSPAHAFLSSDPFEKANSNAASPIIKSSPHRRLRSISQKLSLARIAITPSTKKWDSRLNARAGNMPPTPATPLTPLTAPLPSTNKLRRNSRLMPSSRPGTARGPSPDAMPLLPTSHSTDASPRKAASKMVARGADEREPVLELPPCPDEDDVSPMNSIKTRRVRKRKSLMDLL